MSMLTSKLATKLLKLRIRENKLKVRVKVVDARAAEDGEVVEVKVAPEVVEDKAQDSDLGECGTVVWDHIVHLVRGRTVPLVRGHGENVG